MAEHNTLTGSALHEPKGIGSAGTSDAGKVLTPSATTAGEGELRYLTESEITTKLEYITVYFPDVSTAQTIYFPAPCAGTVTKVTTCLNGAIATSDAAITSSVNATPMTNGAITIAFSGSAAGDIDSASPTANNAITTTDYIAIATDGASTNTVALYITIEIQRS